jgi:hypothetical protein
VLRTYGILEALNSIDRTTLRFKTRKTQRVKNDSLYLVCMKVLHFIYVG